MKQSSLEIRNLRQPVTVIVEEPTSYCLCRSVFRITSISIYATGLVGCLYAGAESVGYVRYITTDGLLFIFALSSVALFAAGLTGSLTSSVERAVVMNVPVLTCLSVLVYLFDMSADLLNDGTTATTTPIDSFILGNAIEGSEEFKDLVNCQLCAAFVLCIGASALLTVQLLTSLLLLCHRKSLYPVPL